MIVRRVGAIARGRQMGRDERKIGSQWEREGGERERERERARERETETETERCKVTKAIISLDFLSLK